MPGCRMPTALGSRLLGVDEGMEPQEQGGVALGSASARPEALPATVREAEGGRREQAGEQPAPGLWGTLGFTYLKGAFLCGLPTPNGCSSFLTLPGSNPET